LNLMAGSKAALRRPFVGKFLIALCGLALALMVVRELVIGISPAHAEDAPAAPAEAAAPAAPAAKDATAPAAPAAKDAGEAAAPVNKDAVVVPMLIARELQDEPLPISLLDLPPADLGVAGAKLAVADNNTTGRFMNQQFTLEEVDERDPAKLVEDVVKKVDAGAHFILADMAPATLLKLADALKGKDAIIINYGAPDDRLREEDCRANVLHSAPTRSMLADALAQYLIWKKWNHWLLVLGPRDEDKLFADAIRRSAKRFGGKIVEERPFVYETGSSRRSDGGYEQIQQQIPTFTQSAPAYDVLVVADEANIFGDYFPYRTWDARPVVGTSGLVAVSWHPAIELWGGTQFQNRFKRLADRYLRPEDYNAWLAARMVGEAASRTKSSSFKDLAAYLKSPQFEVAGFKGVGLSVRSWNGQVRQPIPVTTPKLLVTVSPQPGFLHQSSELDTLGVDKPETKCKAYIQ
jgi:ABC transporter substrate binding protein (PQQ-dependent alcohol dehydrogenase system)